MKIFDWMHRKLHISTEYHRVAHRNVPVMSEGTGEKRSSSRVPATGVLEMERETRALLIPHMLLAIGTLGHSHPPPPPPLPLEKLLEADADQLDINQSEPVEEYSTAGAGAETAAAVVLHPCSNITIKLAMPAATASEEEELEKIIPKLEQNTAAEEEIVSEEPLLQSHLAQKRITLAELFAQEVKAAVKREEEAAAAAAPPIQLKSATSANTKQMTADGSKKKMKKKKKDVKKKHEESLPTAKKIHRLITKMLKKKIHPEGAARGGEEPLRHNRKGGATVVVDDNLQGGWSGAAGSVNLINSC